MIFVCGRLQHVPMGCHTRFWDLCEKNLNKFDNSAPPKIVTFAKVRKLTLTFKNAMRAEQCDVTEGLNMLQQYPPRACFISTDFNR